jgi:butyryl-CoA dehydrogenase
MDFELNAAQRELSQRAWAAGLPWRSHVKTWDAEDLCPYDDIKQSITEAGLLGLTMPKRYGGQGLTALDYVLVIENLFRSSQSWIVGEPTFCSSGPGPSLILLSENERTREKFLPDIISGRLGCAIALTEPGHGSDLGALETTAVLDGDHYVVNGSKRFITGSPVNELYATFVRIGDAPGGRGVGALVAEKGAPGLRLERGAHFVGSRGLPHGEVHFEDCRVPRENLIAGPGSFGRLMSAFNMERIHNSTYSLGFGQAAFDEAVAYVERRKAFGKDIIEFQASYHTLVDMWCEIEAQRLLTYRAAATAVDGIFPAAMESSLSKLTGCTMLPQVTLQAMILCGGDGTTLDFPVQRLHRDAIAAMVAGGSPPVLKNAIAAQLFPGRKFRQD